MKYTPLPAALGLESLHSEMRVSLVTAALDRARQIAFVLIRRIAMLGGAADQQETAAAAGRWERKII